MTSILIVDDNRMFRMAFLKMLDWERHGYKIIAEASNGIHALEILKDIHVDIIVTDMSMPEMTGIELVKIISEEKPSIRIIALSNYDDFQFVKDALKYGAYDYLLKHELTGVKILEVLQEVNDSKRKIHQSYLQGSTSEMDSFIGKVLLGQVNHDEMTIGLKDFAGFKKLGSMYLIYIQPYIRNSEIRIMRDHLKLNNNEDIQLVISCVDKNKVLLLINILGNYSEHHNYRYLIEVINNIVCTLDKMHIEASLLVSGVTRDTRNLPDLYKQIEKLKNACQFNRKKSFYYFSNETQETETIEDPSLLIDSKMYNHEIMDNKQLFNMEVKHLFDRIKHNPIDENSLAKVIFELAVIIYHLAKRLNVKLVNVIGDRDNLFRTFYQFYYFSDVEVKILRILEELYGTSDEYQTINNRNVEDIINYINKHYNEDLTLMSISERFGYNASYLSHLYKHQTGKNLVDYIKEVRIREAKRLILESRYKSYEIAQKTGFKNASYFCTVFKEVTGHSPKAFKKRGYND